MNNVWIMGAVPSKVVGKRHQSGATFSFIIEQQQEK